MKPVDRTAFVVGLMAIGLWSLAGGFLGLHLSTPSDGARLLPGEAVWKPEGVVVTPFETRDAGLHTGDVVMAIDGQSLEGWAQALFRWDVSRPQWRLGQTLTYTIQRGAQNYQVPITLVSYPIIAIIQNNWGAILFALLNQLVTAFVFFKRPTERPAQVLFLGAAGMVSATTWSFGLTIGDLVGGLGFWLFKATTLVAYLLVWITALHFALIFPRPSTFLSRWRWVIPALYLIPYAIHAIYFLVSRLASTNTLAWLGNADGDVSFTQVVYLSLTLIVAITGYRATREPVSRAQIRWVFYAFIVVFTLTLLLAMLPELILGYPFVSWNGIALCGLLVPIALALAILRYRLFDIDVIINRTLVYGALTAFIIGVYLLAVGSLGALLQTNNRLTPLLLTAVAVVIVFRPLRARLQVSVDHLMYGRVGPPQAPGPNAPGELPSDPAFTPVRLWHNATSLAVLVMALGLTALGIAFFWLHLSTPTDGARLQPGEFVWTRAGVVVTPLDESPGGLQRGDVVMAVAGQSLEAWAQDMFRWKVARPNHELGQTVVYTIVRAGSRQEVSVKLGPYPVTQLLAQYWGVGLLLLVNQAVAAYVFFRRPQDLATRLLFLTATNLLVGGSVWAVGLQLSDLTGALGFWLYTLAVRGAYILGWVTLFHFTLVFPKPLPGIAQRPAFLWGLYSAPYLAYFGFLALTRLREPSTLLWLEGWRVAHGSINILYISLAVLMTSLSYRRTSSDPIARRQIYWLFFAFVIFGVLEIGFGLVPEILRGRPLLDWNLIALSGVLIPIASAIAILRYHLFDIDVILNRALVYGALTALVVSLYVAMVATASLVFQAGNNLLVSLTATGIVAVLFQPLRARFQRTVNRLMYGERDDPYVVLSRLGQRLEATLAAEAVLPTLTETIAQTLKLPYVAIALQPGNGSEPEVTTAYGLPTSVAVRLPLTYQSEPVGELWVATRAPGETFTLAEHRLLTDIAHQAGIAAHAVRLTADLQRSRERLVTTREEERRRLRRDLHDGLGPALAAQTLKVGSARALLTQESALQAQPNVVRATRLLTELESDIEAALSDIRRLVYDLRPPALDELGLAAAIRENAMRYDNEGLHITVETPEHLPHLPAAVEVAAYRVMQEALTNVVRHARARTCRIALTLDDALRLEIRDDGIGLPKDRRAGVGLTSMHERTEELGGVCVIESLPAGGTRIFAQLPCQILESP